MHSDALLVIVIATAKAVLYSLISGIGISVVSGAGSPAPHACSTRCESAARPRASPGAH